MDLKIEKMTLDDLESINDILLSDFDDFWSYDILKKELEYPNSYFIIAKNDNEIVGFGDIDESGYLDRLFVHTEHQREGIASAICDKLEQAVSIRKFTTHSSITARPFFEHRGYRVIREQTVIRNGIALTNFIMEK